MRYQSIILLYVYLIQGISEQPITITVKITPWVGTKIGLFTGPPHLGLQPHSSILSLDKTYYLYIFPCIIYK